MKQQNLLWLWDVVVENLVASQGSHEAGIFDGPVDVHERREGLEAVQRLAHFQAEDKDVAVLDADNKLVGFFGVEFHASDWGWEV